MTPADTNPLRALEPCPFCGNALTSKRGQINPYAKCETEGCFGTRCPVVGLDVPTQVDAWNTRVASEPVAGTVRTAPADFKCESEEFNGPKCKSQCSSCRNIPSNYNPTTGEMENQETDPAYFEPSTALSVAPVPSGRETMVAAILERRYPHRKDRQQWIDAFLNGKSAGISGMFYHAVNDAFADADAILALGATVTPQGRVASEPTRHMQCARCGEVDFSTGVYCKKCTAITPPAPGAADRAAVIEECAKVADDFSAPGRFKVSDQWKGDMSPSEVYETGAIDVSNWIAEAIRGLAPKVGGTDG